MRWMENLVSRFYGPRPASLPSDPFGELGTHDAPQLGDGANTPPQLPACLPVGG